jgi:hypothetical protein
MTEPPGAAPADSLLVPEISQAHRPLRLPAALSGSALGHWSAGLLAERFGSGEVPVEYSLRDVYCPRPDLNNGKYFRKALPFKDALARIVNQDHYAANYYISSLDIEELAPQLDPLLPRFRDGLNRSPMSRFLFVGNSRSGTHVHYDLPDNLIVVLAGRKRISFFPPAHLRRMKPFAPAHPCCNFSSLSDRQVRAALSQSDDRDVFSLTADRGDMIYIPSCWLHRVTNEGFTIALSNFWEASPAAASTWAYRRYKRAL